MDGNRKNIFISYSNQDEQWARRIEKHLESLNFNYFISSYKDIPMGTKWESEIYTALNKADIVILLVSANFLSSDLIRSMELGWIEKRYKKDEIKVFPIIVSECLWENNKLISQFQVLPKNGKSLNEIDMMGKDIDKILKDIVESIEYISSIDNRGMKVKIINDYFIGRENEKQQIEKILLENKNPICEIWGKEGIGKTSIIREVVNDLKDKNKFEDIIWIDFNNDKKSNISIISYILDYDFSVYINNQRFLHNAINEKLYGKKILVILDSCELDIESFKSFYEIFRDNCPILIGSRENFDFIPNRIHLESFTDEEIQQFIKHNFNMIHYNFNQEKLIDIENTYRKANQTPLTLRYLNELFKTRGFDYVLENKKEILEDITAEKYSSIKTITQFDNDHINSKKDYLNISDDIDAFAKLISYKELKPPLSIALFGNWGSGKSTFMEMLEDRIETYTDLNQKDFCKSKSVVHVRFNAWHYSDTNLWASLVSHIFKELDKHINGKDKENRVSIYAKLLDSQREKIEEKESQQTKIEKEIHRLKESIEEIENKKIDKTKEIKEISLKDISKEVLEDKDIKKELEEIKKEFVFTHGDDISKIKKTYDELNTTYSTYKKAIWLLYHNKKSRWYLGISIVVFIILSGLSYIYTDDTKSYISSLVAIVIGGKVFLDTYIKKFSPLTGIIEKFIKNYEDKEVLLKDDEKIGLEKEIAHKNLEIKEIKQQIQIEKDKKVELEKEIEKIKSGEYLANFIADRSNSDDYTQHLGLVSVIREDFDKLKEQIELLEKDAKFNIERIVLYIDDLDRCADDKVVKVLEAIHLLLAFELFVVVVGVDSRWITNSLVKECELSQNENDKPTDKATPYDYLEKIFQIPFKIKPLSKSNKTNLINELLKGEIKEDSEETQESKKEDEVNISNQPNVDLNFPKNEPKSIELNSEDKPLIPQKTDEDKNKIEDNYEKMKFSKKEIEFMEELVDYIGETPRTIKRFINIYRIIKNHQEIKSVSDSEDEYKLILVILCLVFTDIEYLIKDKNEREPKLPSDILEIYKNSEEIKRKQYVDFILRFSFKD